MRVCVHVRVCACVCVCVRVGDRTNSDGDRTCSEIRIPTSKSLQAHRWAAWRLHAPACGDGGGTCSAGETPALRVRQQEQEAPVASLREQLSSAIAEIARFEAAVVAHSCGACEQQLDVLLEREKEKHAQIKDELKYTKNEGGEQRLGATLTVTGVA